MFAIQIDCPGCLAEGRPAVYTEGMLPTCAPIGPSYRPSLNGKAGSEQLLVVPMACGYHHHFAICVELFLGQAQVQVRQGETCPGEECWGKKLEGKWPPPRLTVVSSHI